jgi:hypothetical protein
VPLPRIGLICGVCDDFESLMPFELYCLGKSIRQSMKAEAASGRTLSDMPDCPKFRQVLELFSLIRYDLAFSNEG